ncbi:MAG: SDR family oxidoreductase [Actinomycetota bacterium]|nr:SDR family oxidoreductase [Actinomycetota bacterium]
MILVVGATGYLGGRVCQELVAQGKPVTAMVRAGDDDAKVAPLRAAGVELVEGDLKDPASLERACQGKSAVISTASSSISSQSGDTIDTVDRDGQRHLVDAAKGAGVGRFVYISFSKNMVTEGPLTAAKRAVEQHLMASGLDYTILRCGFLMEIMVTPMVGFDFANASAVVYGTGESPVSWVSIDDVARLAVVSLDTPAAGNAVFEFGGEAVTMHEAVRIFEEVSGRTFEVQHVPEEALEAQRDAATDLVAKSLGALMLDYARGDAIDAGPALAACPMELTTMHDYAAKVLSTP